jgi:predicted permease
MRALGSELAGWWRGRRLPGASWLDVKLGLRMLVKHPAVTLVAVFALAVGIPVGLLPLHIVDAFNRPLPVEDGDDVVMVSIGDPSRSQSVAIPLRDLAEWRRELVSFEELGAVRSRSYNVLSEDGGAAPVSGAAVTASVFSLLRVPPLLGRPLEEADEVVGAPDVVVIGHDLWQSRLAGDADVVGGTIRIGGVPHTVVGVMPEGFLFPLRNHLWLPLRDDVLDSRPGDTSIGRVIGRLAAGASIDEARAELELVGQRMVMESSDRRGPLRARVSPYAAAATGFGESESRTMLSVGLLALLVLGIACGNVGILILVRAAGRTRELAIRNALGAGRVRIVSQLFVESLVLAVLAGGVGLLIGEAVSRRFGVVTEPYLPFWLDFGVSARTVARAMSLAVFCAVVAGVVPALKATGRNVQEAIRSASGGGSGIRFGAASGLLIVVEVAVAVGSLSVGSTLLPGAVRSLVIESTLVATTDWRQEGLGIEADRYLYAALWMPRLDTPTGDVDSYAAEFEERIRHAQQQLALRLPEEPGFGQVAIASALPGMDHRTRRIEIEGETPSPDALGHRVHVARVDVGYFEALGQPVLSGRGFNSADIESRSAIIVNESFVERVMRGRNPLGRRVRYAVPPGAEGGPWWEIVGVVGRLGMSQLRPQADEGIYEVAAPGELRPIRFAVRVGDDPEALVPRLRAIVARIDPSAMILEPSALDEVFSDKRFIVTWLAALVTLLSSVALVLSAAGLYALVSFTVAERTHEIGIRTALGAQAANIVSTIAKQVFLQLSVGVLLGIALSAWIMPLIVAEEEPFFYTDHWQLTVGLAALGVVAVGMLACVPPTRRALTIHPVDALKAQ